MSSLINGQFENVQKLYGFYEYGLDTQANRWQTWYRSDVEICLHAFSASESSTAKKERSRAQ